MIKLIAEEHLDGFVDLVTNAYTEFDYHLPSNRANLKERLSTIQQEDSTINFYGYYKNNDLLGCMRFHDYDMNVRGSLVRAGGIGLVAVDLLHKKEKIAKEMLIYFLDHYQNRGATIAMLYPFRPDFYKRMGFGFGTKMHHYRIRPEYFPKGVSKSNLRFLHVGDSDTLLDCYNRYMEVTNGLLNKTDNELLNVFKNPANRIIGCEIEGVLTGYCIFTFTKGNSSSFLVNDIQVKELVYLNPKTLSEIFTFFHSQSDQIRNIEINTQDEEFHYLFSDPRNGTDQLIPFVYHETNTSGVGIMYRVLDVERLFKGFENLVFPSMNITIQWNISDNLMRSNNTTLTTTFNKGELKLENSKDIDVKVTIDIAEFSSFITGAVNLSNLARFGLVTVDEESRIKEIDRLFAVTKPFCLSGF